jgi:phosphoglycerate dehydrogenase-like enzyme
MTWRILITAPYFIPVVEEYRARLEAAGLELVVAGVRERLSEDDLLPLVPTMHGAICGDDQFTERVLHAAPHLKVISKWGTGIDSIDAKAASRLGIPSYHLIDRAQLELMRPTAYLINTSRGAVVNERALIDALRNGRIAGAALDVFESEPLAPDSPLLEIENCLLAPHNANCGREAKKRVHESTIQNLLDGLKQEN